MYIYIYIYIYTYIHIYIYIYIYIYISPYYVSFTCFIYLFYYNFVRWRGGVRQLNIKNEIKITLRSQVITHEGY